MLLDPLGFSGTHPRRFIMFSQNGGDDVCAREGGKHIQICASPFIKEFCMARHRFVFESRPSFFLKGSRPSPLPPIPFFKPPPRKKSEWRGAARRERTRAYSRVGRDSDNHHAIG